MVAEGTMPSWPFPPGRKGTDLAALNAAVHRLDLDQDEVEEIVDTVARTHQRRNYRALHRSIVDELTARDVLLAKDVITLNLAVYDNEPPVPEYKARGLEWSSPTRTRVVSWQ
jgi:hypothetical protein